MTINEQASAVLNNVVTGLHGLNSNLNISVEQIEDQVILERAKVIMEYLKNGVLDASQIAQTIPCINLECGSTELCCSDNMTNSLYAEIPKVLNGYILYVGSNDRMAPFKVYTDSSFNLHKYRRRSSQSPYVFLDNTDSKTSNARIHVFNAPLMSSITITAVFTDPRIAKYMSACGDGVECTEEYTDDSMIANDTIHRLTEKLMRYYRSIALQPTINDQTPKP